MPLSNNRGWWLLGALLVLRLVSMAIFPLTDTTETRYAEIARLMAESGDWITPWFEPGVPFWGKPPLAFWSEALAFRTLGVSEFAARLPSWLATLATLALIFALARAFFGRRAAAWAMLIYSTSLLPYVAAGAVLTDPFLVLGTTLSMTAFVLAPRDSSPLWRYGFFLGLAIGLLAKGPLALVLVAGPLLPWVLWHHNAREYVGALPWKRGSLLIGLLCLPWYIAAELKTPGFLNYFIVGEHVLRFIDSGWAGDLYGSAHDRPYGTIWLLAMMAAFPWSLIGLGMLLTTLAKSSRRTRLYAARHDARTTYLLAWSLFPPLFFSFAGNVLWTYVLPALPAFAVLLATRLHRGVAPHMRRVSLTVPVAALALALLVALQPERVKSEKELIVYANRISGPEDLLLFVQERPFSARFYSRGTAALVSLDQLPEAIARAPAGVQLAVPPALLALVQARLARTLEPHFRSRRYALVALAARTGDVADSADGAAMRQSRR